MSTTTFGWLVLLFPLVGMTIISASFRRLSGRSAGVIGTLAIGLAFAAAVCALVSLQGHPESHRELTSKLWDYAVSAGVDAQLSILVDPLSIFMALIVSGVSSLIHLYSIAYMKSDRGY
ncbi:MAG: NADH-quinone oxidoreductase subunit L, partial [Solirubrobacteraceae bacterium]